jgi:hypothetical protein
MPKSLGTLLVAGALSLVITIAISAWLESPEETLLYPVEQGIEKIDVEFGRNTIHLNVYLNRPLTCKQVIKQLGIETLPVKNKVYSPTCSTVSDNFIKIVYAESLTV